MNNLRNLMHLVALTGILLLTGCDPVHELKLENRTKSKIEVIFYSETRNPEEIVDNEFTKINVYDREMNVVILNSAETMKIGMAIAHYTPKPGDIQLDYLEIRMKTDTIKLEGKNAILSAVQKVKSLDWRLMVGSE